MNDDQKKFILYLLVAMALGVLFVGDWMDDNPFWTAADTVRVAIEISCILLAGFLDLGWRVLFFGRSKSNKNKNDRE